jgi:plastocyanin
MLPVIARARTLGLSIVLATAGLGGYATIPVSANGSVTWHVQAGNLDDLTFTSVAHEVLAFYNARTVVHPGDDILFTPIGDHSVVFNPKWVPGVPNFAYEDPNFPIGPTGNTLGFANRPGGHLLTSGGFATPPPPGSPPPPPGSPPTQPPTFTLHIGSDAAGPGGESHAKRSAGEDGGKGTTYQFFCMFHREMTGFITVLPAGSKLPSTDAKNQIRAQKAMAADLALGRRTLARASNNVEDNRVAAGLGVASVQGLGSDTILRFAPATIEIKTGESVTWINKDINAPHTVTFGAEIPGPPGAPPGFLPYGGTTIASTSDQVNSGFLIYQELIDYLNVSSLIPPGFVVTHQATFTFTKAGTYPYFCALHDFVGMVGTVIVRDENDNG